MLTDMRLALGTYLLLLTLSGIGCGDRHQSVCERFDRLWQDIHEQVCRPDWECCECLCALQGQRLTGTGQYPTCSCAPFSEHCEAGSLHELAACECFEDTEACRIRYEGIITAICAPDGA